MKTQKLVTKEWLAQKVATGPTAAMQYKDHTINKLSNNTFEWYDNDYLEGSVVQTVNEAVMAIDQSIENKNEDAAERYFSRY